MMVHISIYKAAVCTTMVHFYFQRVAHMRKSAAGLADTTR